MRFVAYGLTIDSELLVSNLPDSDREPQVRVRLAPVEKPICDAAALRASVITPDEFRVYWRGVGTYLIRQGCEILIEPEAGVEEALVQLYLLGPALAILLHQRGLLVLHASVIRINGFAVGFMGEKGWGKSTTAAALNARGYALVADDILAVMPNGDERLMVHPGPPNFKLWPEAAVASFGDDPNALARLHSQIEKRTRFANTGFLGEPLPLRHLYVLDRGAELESVPLAPAEALLALVRHSYLSGLMQSLGGLDANFRQCVQLAGAVPVRSLKRPKNLNALVNIVELVEQDVAEHPVAADWLETVGTR